MLTSVPDAHEAECIDCGWFSLQPSRHDALVRFYEVHACRGGAT
jgi:hypothetical protein